jgi:DNA-binding MarR family transcriptional regulator
MRQLNGLYAQRFNQRHQRAGHLLQGRYQAILVDKDIAEYIAVHYTTVSKVIKRIEGEGEK